MSFSAAYISDVTARINGANSCADLQAAAGEVMGPLSVQVSALNAQIAALAPFIALATAPTDLPSVLSWITNLIAAQIQPQVVAAAALPGQVAQLTTAIANLTSAISTAQARFPSCVIVL